MKATFLHPPADIGENVLLVGIDFEGDSRESRYFHLADAIAMAYCCSVKDEIGPPWKSWEIWGNVLSKDSEWEPVVISS